MKVLWFSLSPCGSIRRKQTIKYNQGWMISLEDEIKKHKEIQLSVSYIANSPEEPFTFDGVDYYPVVRNVPSNAVSRVLDRFSPGKKDNDVALQMQKVIAAVHPDIIHIHGTEECFGMVQKYVHDIPIVFSIQGLIAPYTEKYFSGMPAEYVRKYEHWTKKFRKVSVMDHYNSFRRRGKRELDYLNHAQYVIGRTNFDHFIPMLCNPDVRLYQGEELLRDSFYEKTWNKTNFGDTIRIVSTISGGVYKGYEMVLHSAYLLSKYADFNFEWQIIGYDRSDEWVEIAEKIKGIKTDNVHVELLGRLQAAEMVEVMTGSDIFVQVSHIENSPNSLCEAMLLGMPIVASFAGGSSSLLRDGEEGILVQDGDPYVTAGAIVNMTKDFARAKQMGENARNRALVRHDRTTVGSALVTTYKSIIDDFASKTSCEKDK